MTNNDDLLVRILHISHEQVMAGESYSQEEVERYLDERLYEKTTELSERTMLKRIGYNRAT